MKKILEINNLSVNYYRNKKTIHALTDVSLSMEENETVSIVGESGCGKSTLGYSVLKLIDPAEGAIINGEIIYRGDGIDNDIISMDNQALQKIRGKEISIILQDPFSSLNPVLTAGSQITETLTAHNILADIPERKQKALELIKQVKLQGGMRIYDAYPHQLSGGQRQRICIAIGIATGPKILIADEPTTALDVTTEKEILELLWQLQSAYKMGIIFITHNLHIAFQHSRRLAVMYAGEIVESGITEDIRREPKHPYTAMLFNVMPSPDKRGEPLPTIPGQVPDMTSIPKGCRFRPRCSKAMQVCTEINPDIIGITDSHMVKCHLYNTSGQRPADSRQ